MAYLLFTVLGMCSEYVSQSMMSWKLDPHLWTYGMVVEHSGEGAKWGVGLDQQGITPSKMMLMLQSVSLHKSKWLCTKATPHSWSLPLAVISIPNLPFCNPAARWWKGVLSSPETEELDHLVLGSQPLKTVN